MPGASSAADQGLFASALRHHQAGRLQEAEQIYRRILQADSRNADALHFLGVLAHQTGRHAIAVELIVKAIGEKGHVPTFHNNLGNAFAAQGKWQSAVASYERALIQRPDYVEAHYNLGIALQAQDLLQAAADSYGKALHLQPEHANARNNLGNVLQAQGKVEEAASAYRHALRDQPGHADAHNNLGNILQAGGRYVEAVLCYERALRHNPHHAEAYRNLGNTLLQLNKLDEAAASYRMALSKRPNFAAAHSGLGNALKEQGKPGEALLSYRRALAIDPDCAEARLGLAVAAIPIFADSVADSAGACESFSRALDELSAWGSAHPGQLGNAAGSNQPFYLGYRPCDVRAPLSRYGDLISTAAAVPRPPQRERIRIGIVSGQIRRHPVWDVVLRGLIAHLDRRRFDIALYHTSALTDEETAWAKACTDRFVQGPMPAKAWIGKIAEHQPDVMFYPEVGMDPGTCALAALRLAPLQAAGWGHPVTTGLPNMDLFLSGELLEGPDAERHYREKLVLLPGTGVCTQSAAFNPLPWEGPDRRSGVVRFALCQQPIKFDPADDVLIARIAKAVGPSEFWLASPLKLDWATARLRDRLAAAFRAEGLDPDAHLRVMPWLRRGQFAGFLDETDIYLDCPAFSGYTTAWQAMHRGVPIVTLEGEFLRQRLAAGLLRQTGSTDGIAASRDRYVEIAVRWAEECRQAARWTARRQEISRAAQQADGNRSAVSAFEQALIDALRGGA